jgi:hypothetical protein
MCQPFYFQTTSWEISTSSELHTDTQVFSYLELKGHSRDQQLVYYNNVWVRLTAANQTPNYAVCNPFWGFRFLLYLAQDLWGDRRQIPYSLSTLLTDLSLLITSAAAAFITAWEIPPSVRCTRVLGILNKEWVISLRQFLSNKDKIYKHADLCDITADVVDCNMLQMSPLSLLQLSPWRHYW